MRIGLGCMRLSTVAERDDARSVDVIHAALDAGATILDTADTYCRDDSEIGHNERLIASALRGWSGDRSRVQVATKGGMKRPKGAWIADGKAKHLRAACEASLRALGVDAIDLYQLHVVDPRTPFETSVRALAALRDEGKVKQIGLCNVTVTQIKAARTMTEIASVQVSVSPFDDDNLRNGVAEYCREAGIQLIAYRPLGGVDRVGRLAKLAPLVEIASHHGVTPQEVALAWLMDLGVVPVPGATQVATARSIARALGVRLSDDNRRALDAQFSGRLLRVPRSERQPKGGADGEVVLVMGMPAAGKSGIARALEAEGYRRLNRDARGGTLASLVGALDEGLATGVRRWVLDNTYPSRSSRNEVIECAWKHGVPVRCIHLTTTIADAQVNAITRLLELHGTLPTPEELRDRGKSDPRYFGPDAQFRYERAVEPPSQDEGYSRLEEREFVRRQTPGADRRAVVLEYDDVLVRSAAGDDPALRSEHVLISDEVRHALHRLHGGGWLLFAHAWRPQIARGELAAAEVHASFARVRALLGVEIALAFCPHDAGPPICWCRKPLPGSILEFALPRGVSLGQSVYIGRAAADETLAHRLGMTYVDDLTMVVSSSTSLPR